MRALMRATDWSRTGLGPVEGWPRSLKTMVGVLLGNRFPMLLFWGPALLQLYNDGYRPILGLKHPASLGAPGGEVWAEIWDIIGPMAQGVLAGGPATWSEHLLLPMNRQGFIEETYFTFSYSPVPDDTGRVGGILVTVQETTDQVLSARQLHLLRDLAAHAADASSVTEACRVAAGIFAANDADLPFSLLYLLAENDPGQARLAGTAGLDGYEGPARPERVSLAGAAGAASWPLAAAARLGGEILVDDLAVRFGPLPGGRWATPPERAIVLPLARPGQPRPYGFLVAGLSPRRPLDEAYRGLFRLIADQVVTALANACAHEEERRRAAELCALDRAKTLFFSNVSHEFRTPLTLILGPMEDALRSPAPVLAGERLVRTHRNALRLLKLVNTLLDFARLEAGRAQASYEPTDLAALTVDLASAFRSAMERAGLAFEVACPPLAEPAFVDRDMWEKIVLNLLSNALKFTFEGVVRLTLQRRGDHLELVVSDTGAGIPEAQLPRVFERFHRVGGGRARTHEGSGIGLALVQELVRLHGGTITASSRLGVGTVFVVSIPCGAAHLPPERICAHRALASTALGAAPFVEEALRWLPDGAPPPSEDGADLEIAAILPEGRVLLAEDNADMRAYARRILGERWAVTAVGDGDAALASARASLPDLVVADVMMPGLDGFGLLRALRADPRTRGVPVLLLSARAGEEARVEGLRAGADDYLVKPFSAPELVARVAIHLQLGQRRRAAEEERERLRGLLAQVPAAVNFLRGPDLVFELAHPITVRMLGGREVLGRPLLEAVPAPRGQSYAELLGQVYATGEAVHGERRLAHPGGEGAGPDTVWSYTYLPVRGRDGAIEGVMTFDLEITEQARARQALEAAARERDELLRRAEEASRAKDEFLAMLGHELRNPLAPIVTALHLMCLRAGGVVERERLIIERQVQHLTTLVDDLLDVSRITQGKIELRRQRLEIAEVVAKAIEQASPLFERRGHHLTVTVPARGLVVEGDATRLGQVVSNLLTNAAKYTASGGKVAVVAAREGDEVVLRVRDSGIGIPPEVLPHIFEMFVQERQALDRSQGGLGLGLAIVKSLVVLHGGTVSAHSEGRGRGSELILRLPAASLDAPDLEAEGPSSAWEEGAASSVRRLRILIVDDNPDAAELLADSLSELGYALCVAHDGPTALRLAETFVPEVALLDIGLPVMDGYELGRRLREQPACERVRLIAISGYGQGNDHRRSEEASFDAHLVKPVPLDRLRALLDPEPAGA
jgi:signal transduction histidine kinase/DNA-binding response OmpR family regulator